MQIAQHLQQTPTSYIREILSDATAEGVISLAGGLPASDHFPIDLIEPSLQSLARAKPEVFQYGETQGYRPLLDFFQQIYQLPETHSALVCNGSQQALDLIARTFLNPGDGVAMEAPSYLGALQVFAIAQARVESVTQQADGPDLNELAELFASGKVKLFYAVPDFHNPTGLSWSLATRKAVAELCIAHGITLIEDAPYRELRFTGTALPLVSSFCPDHALVLRSFSKIATPGFRLGVATGPSQWLDEMIKVKQAADLHTNLPMQEVLLQLLQHQDFPKHIDHLRQLYRSRYQCLADALHKELPAGCEFDDIEGGMFIWLNLPEGDPMAIAKAAIKEKVAVVPSTVFYDQGTEGKPALRLNFSYPSPDELQVAAQRLAKVLAG